MKLHYFIPIIAPTEQVTGLSAHNDAPSNPEIKDWKGSLAVICNKVSEHRLLYLETGEWFVFMLIVTDCTLIWCMGFRSRQQTVL